MTKATTSTCSSNLNEESRVLVIPFGTTTPATLYGPFVHTHGLDPRNRVVEGYFSASAFPEKRELPTYCDVRLIELAPMYPPVVMFTLQVGASAAHWFADLADRHTCDLLAHWDSFGTMALAANLDDGRVLFGVQSYTIQDKVLERLREMSADMRSRGGSTFAQMMTIMHVHDDLSGLMASELPDFPTLENACINVVCTDYTDLVTFPIARLPPDVLLPPSHARFSRKPVV